MRVSALDGRLVFIMRRQTLGAELRGKQYEEAARASGHADFHLLAFELGLLVGCTEEIVVKSKKNDNADVVSELQAFADWFAGIGDPSEAWAYYVDCIPRVLVKEWRDAFEQVNTPLLPVEQKAFGSLTDQQKQEAMQPDSPLDGSVKPSPTA